MDFQHLTEALDQFFRAWLMSEFDKLPKPLRVKVKESDLALDTCDILNAYAEAYSQFRVSWAAARHVIARIEFTEARLGIHSPRARRATR